MNPEHHLIQETAPADYSKEFRVWHRTQFPEKFLVLDEDGPLARLLSPRTSELPTVEARIAAALKEFKTGMGIALTVEELCPGGLDPADGILIAQAFEQAGARFVIASGGTADFPVLKFRRETHIQKSGTYPWLASACWLIGRVQIPVYAQGYFDLDSEPEIVHRAKGCGLSGLIRL